MQSKEFLEHVKNHKMTVLHDDDAYKHLRFRQPNTSDRYFELMFYPNNCVITGDMGAWTFSRIEDMMKFHRGEGLDIDFCYWKEKVVSCSRFGAGNMSEFSDFNFDNFKNEINNYIDDYFEHSLVEQSKVDDLKRDVSDCIFDDIDDRKHCKGADLKAYELLSEYEYHYLTGEGSKTFRFEDVHEFGCWGEITGYFAFACYAIRWGIQQYDEAQDERTA